MPSKPFLSSCLPSMEVKLQIEIWNYKAEKIATKFTFQIKTQSVSLFHLRQHHSIPNCDRDSRLQLFSHFFSPPRLLKILFPKRKSKNMKLIFCSLGALLCHMCSEHTLMECVCMCVVMLSSPSTRHIVAFWVRQKTFPWLRGIMYMLCGKWHEIWVWFDWNWTNMKMLSSAVLHITAKPRRVCRRLLVSLSSVMWECISIQLSVNSLA